MLLPGVNDAPIAEDVAAQKRLEKLTQNAALPLPKGKATPKKLRGTTVVVGESVTFAGGIDWLREAGVKVIDLADERCIEMMERFTTAHPALWNEDIGED